ncbi:metal ABC transporter permease [Okibacterium endophyticum]
MDVVSWFTEPLQYGFMLRAILSTVIAAVSCGLLSCWLVQIGWSLMGDAVSHAVLPGVVLAYLIGWPFAVGAFVFGVGAVALIGGIQSTTRIRADAAIGVVFTSLFALGIVLVSVTPSQIDLSHILFGNVLGVSPGDLAQVAAIGFIVCAVLLVKRRDFTLFAFDPMHAHAIGLNTRALRTVLLGMLALTVVVTLQSVGIVLVVAMLIIPGATAYLVAASMGRMLVVATAATTAAALVGTYVSFYADWSTGGSVVLAQATLFALAYLFGPAGGVIPRRMRARRAGQAPAVAGSSRAV